MLDTMCSATKLASFASSAQRSASRIAISKRYIQCKGVLTMSHGIRLCSKAPFCVLRRVYRNTPPTR